MSGPKVAIYVPPAEPVTALVAAAAIHAAAAVAEGYAAANALRAEHAAAQATAKAELASSTAAGLAALQESAAAADADFERLAALATRLGIDVDIAATRPIRPQQVSATSLAAYVRGMQMLAAELRNILTTEAALRNADFSAPEDTGPAEIAVPHQQTLSERLLARIAHLGPIPEDLAALAGELATTLPGERNDLLAAEMRRGIQHRLELHRREMLQRATSTIVEQSLHDLGYQVETIADTLFVEGGVVHFRRAGWGDYLVRLRVDPKASTVNFNVIKAVDAGSNERSVLDHLAEDRWCAEFPALLKALETRGIALQVTRHLAAGELPVQLVDRQRLPRFADEESIMSVVQPKAREVG